MARVPWTVSCRGSYEDGKIVAIPPPLKRRIAKSGCVISDISRVTGHGSRVTGHGSRVTGHGSRVTGHGSRVTGHGSRVTGHGRGGIRGCGENCHTKINRGAQLRGRSTPVVPVRLRRWRARAVQERVGRCTWNGQRRDVARNLLRGVFVAAQEFVSLNLRYHANLAGLVNFGALDAAQAADLYRSGQRDLVGKRQQNLHR